MGVRLCLPPTLPLAPWHPSVAGASLSGSGLAVAAEPCLLEPQVTALGLTFGSNGELLPSACCSGLKHRRKTLTKSIKNETKIRLYW